ncbi:MAG TPA: hypothetical protein VEF33_04340 [Syntrophales bacterium]|nr:hypothetical protein [Syntrophales bacterium]
MHRKNIIISFAAGFLIGICAAVLTINILHMYQQSLSGRPSDVEVSLKKTEQPTPVLQQIGSNVDNLTTPKAIATSEVAKTDEKALAAPQEKDAAVPSSKDEIALGGIKVYIQYARKDKKIIEALSADLRTKGYASVDIENIKHRHRDIRYFHSEDKKAAILLQKQFNNFIAGSTYAKKVNLKIRYLGKVYPKAQKGSLEVWVFF